VLALCAAILAIASGYGSRDVLPVAGGPFALGAVIYSVTNARAAAARDEASTSGGRMTDGKGRSAET